MRFGTSIVTSKFESFFFLLNEYFCKFGIFSGLQIDLDGKVVRLQLYLRNRLAKSSIKSHLQKKLWEKNAPHSMYRQGSPFATVQVELGCILCRYGILLCSVHNTQQHDHDCAIES